MEASKAPKTETFTTTVPAPGAAGTVQDQTVLEMPYAGVVTEVTVISEGAVVANAANFRTLRLLNAGQAGAGVVVVASLALDTPGTDDLAAKDEKNIPLSAVAGATTVAAGDVLVWDETVTGTGVVHTGLQVKVTISRS